MSFIRDLYESNCDNISLKKYEKYIRTIVECEDALNELLDENGKTLLQRIFDTQTEIEGQICYEAFKEGLRVGSKLLEELKNDND